MHAVVVKVTLNDPEAARTELHERVVPTVSQAPGFQSGTWVQLSDSSGHALLVFDSAEAAQAAAGMAREGSSESVTIDSAEVGEVVASA
jgi:hypothetical protein